MASFKPTNVLHKKYIRPKVRAVSARKAIYCHNCTRIHWTGEYSEVISRLKLKIPALHCEGCIDSVRLVLSSLDGIQIVEGDLQSQHLRIEYDLARITPQAISLQLASVGYPVAHSSDRT